MPAIPTAFACNRAEAVGNLKEFKGIPMKQLKLKRSVVAMAIGMTLSAGIVSPTYAADADLDDSYLGNLVLFPYYTTRDGWNSLYNVTNASPKTVALKVRFRESYNSRDVLDFNLVLSPYDVWTGWVAEGPNGPRLFTRDKSCTSPIFPDNGAGLSYVDFSNLGYSGGNADGGPTGIDRAREGHLEFITMGVAPHGDEDAKSGDDPDYPTVYYAKHENGVPRDCAMVDAAFETGPGADSGSLNLNTGSVTAPNNGDPDAAKDFYSPAWSDPKTFEDDEILKGNFSLINFATGIGAGNQGVIIEGWADGASDGPRGSNLVTAQEYPYFLEPTIMSSDGLWTISYDPNDVERELEGAGVLNEWTVNPNTGAASDWIVSFPTKGFHVDAFNNLQAGVNPWRCGLVQDDGDWVIDRQKCPLSPFEEDFDGQSCHDVTLTLYDREEGSVRSSGTSISPAPPVPSEALCYETNVITFGGVESSLGSTLAQSVDISALTSGAQSGWLEIGFFDYSLESGTDPSETGEMAGLGFLLKVRDFGDPNRNFGQIMDHSYRDR